MKILVIQKKFMGDVLVTSTILPLLKDKFPDSEISFLLEEKHAQILIENPYINQYIFFKDSFLKTLSEVKAQNFDIVIDLYSKIETGVLALLSGAKTRIGFFKNYTQFFYTFPVKRATKLKSKNTTFAIEHRLQMLESLGIDFQEAFPKIYLSKKERENAHKILSENGLSTDDNLVMLSTFGSSEEKTYPIEYMAEVINYISLCKPNSIILCNYMPFQKGLFEELNNKLSEDSKKLVITNFETKSLREFAAVTSLCKCLIGNEGGATNVSKSLNIPTFTIFSPQIQLIDWAWTSNSKMDRFLHLNDFVQNSDNYLDFKPTYFKNELREFLNKTIA
ncbi:glycosyltransferase family 9 protein [Epilithonimonas sp.]|uniref:glycosyltransferase family 9 protein n=1 Tax=Epilithonimonas sp. TaxID=2894511 RepID=UPI002899BCB8|nr:glycosyltransferase family 9 protein [Epilithonimonas sp.]